MAGQHFSSVAAEVQHYTSFGMYFNPEDLASSPSSASKPGSSDPSTHITQGRSLQQTHQTSERSSIQMFMLTELNVSWTTTQYRIHLMIRWRSNHLSTRATAYSPSED